MDDITTSIESLPKDPAIDANNKEVEEMVSSGKITVHTYPSLDKYTELRHARRSDVIDRLMNGPLQATPCGCSVAVKEGTTMEELIEKYIIDLNEAEDKEEEDKDEKEEKDDDKEEKKDESKEKDDDKEDKKDDKKDDDCGCKESVDISKLSDDIIGECLRAAEYDVMMVCGITEDTLTELYSFIEENEDPNIIIDEHELSEDILEIEESVELEFLIDCYALTIMTGDMDYLNEAISELSVLREANTKLKRDLKSLKARLRGYGKDALKHAGSSERVQVAKSKLSKFAAERFQKKASKVAKSIKLGKSKDVAKDYIKVGRSLSNAKTARKMAANAMVRKSEVAAEKKAALKAKEVAKTLAANKKAATDLKRAKAGAAFVKSQK